MGLDSPRTKGAASALVVQHLEGLVFDELLPGEQLPSEGALAVELGVSRLTVREGIKQLHARGLIDTQNGRKPVVAIPNGRSVGDYFRSAIRRDPHAILELLEVRLALETHIAGLAAVNATQPSLVAMAGAIRAMEGHLSDADADAFTEADMHFHDLLALSTGNRMLATLYEELAACMRASRARSMQGHRLRGLELAAVVAEHRAIYEAVVEGSASRASATMRRHLKSTKRDLQALIPSS